MEPRNPAEGPWQPYGLLAIVIGLGGLGVVHYGDLPIVRNSLIYARIADFMLEYGLQFSVAEHGYNKALGFPMLSLPWVALFGTNFGLKAASFVWTSLWLGSALFFFRHLGRVFAWDGAPAPSPTLCLALLCCSPLVFFQFGSAYPDSLNALAFLWSLYLLERMTSQSPRVWHGAGFAASVIVSIWIKHHGFVLLALLAVFALCRSEQLAWQWRHARRTLSLSLLSLGLALLVLALAQTGLLAIFNLSQNTENYGGGLGNLAPVVLANLRMLGDFLWLSFTVLVPFLLRWKSFWAFREWYFSLLVFSATILVYQGAPNNIRYFLPVAPLLVWILASNLSQIPRRWRAGLVGAFVVGNVFFTLYYNHLGFNEAVDRVHAFPFRDNLRLTTEIRYRDQDIKAINAHVRPERDVLFHDLPYYEGGGWYVWERNGLFSPDLRIEYMKRPNWRFITGYAREHGLKQALYYGYIPEPALERWGAKIDFKRLSRRSYVLVFRSDP